MTRLEIKPLPTPVNTPEPAPEPVGNRNLRPAWKPGQSGNPGGWGGAMREAQRIARENSPQAMQTLVDLLKDADPRVRAVAAQALLDRALGKPKERAEDPPSETPGLDLRNATAEELAVIRKFVQRGPGPACQRPAVIEHDAEEDDDDGRI